MAPHGSANRREPARPIARVPRHEMIDAGPCFHHRPGWRNAKRVPEAAAACVAAVENTEWSAIGRSTGYDRVVKPASPGETLSRDMTVAIEMGQTTAAAPATLDLEELLATRLLVQGNSGSGKSHLLRRLLEQSAHWVQQTIIDPEGDFVSLSDRFGHLVIDAEEHTERGLQAAGEGARIHRLSAELNLAG